MLEFTENMGQRTNLEPTATLTLTWEQRGKCRQRLRLDNGEEAGLFLTRGQVLREGDILRAGEVLAVVRNAAEPVVTGIAPNWETLARACYHLGNRHVPLQIMPGELRYHHDHVLDDMLRKFDLDVTFAHLPFEPEAGAYTSDAHSHSHAHSH